MFIVHLFLCGNVLTLKQNMDFLCLFSFFAIIKSEHHLETSQLTAAFELKTLSVVNSPED